MKKFSFWLIGLIVISAGVSCCCEKSEKKVEKTLKPYKTGYLKVSDTHELFYQLGGTPEGKAVMVLHGGPGGSCHPGNFKYFNPEIFHVVLHDQRGAGKSKPENELKDNNTWTLVEDIEKLRQFLKLDKVILFGGSWGSTLALAYAETYPENVSGIILRGVFTGTQEEIDHFYHGGTRDHFPETYEKLLKYVDNKEEKNYPEQLFRRISEGDDETKMAAAEAWAMYEGRMIFLNVSEEELAEKMVSWKEHIYTFALIENYYMANNCFLEEGQLFNNIDLIKHIPMEIVHGRYDAICLLKVAYDLHQLVPGSVLTIAEESSHSASEKNVEKGLIEAVKKFE